jgi:phosphomevalonate decarboxylase
VCTGPIHTHTSVEVADDADCTAIVDGETLSARALERVRTVMDAVREAAGDERPWRIVSRNDFPQLVGLGSSSSGFAALATAAADAYGWEATRERLSQVARLGAGSAARALTGGVSEWKVDGERSWAECLAGPDAFDDWAIVVPLVRHPVLTENVHKEVVSSPLFKARVAYIGAALAQARRAVVLRDVESLWAVAEADTLNLHAVTMTGAAGILAWQPATVAVMHAVRALRESGTPAWFSIDTGATAYVNTRHAHADEVARALAEATETVPGVEEMLRLVPAGPAAATNEHLL